MVRDVVSFSHGLAAWDFEEASRAALRLVAADAARRGYLPAEELLEGGVLGLLRVGDPGAAKQLYDELSPTIRGRLELRVLLLTAYLQAYTGQSRSPLTSEDG